MKKLFVLLAAFAWSYQSFAVDPGNEKLIESFKATFPGASQVTWQELPNAFLVSFVDDQSRARAVFKKEGLLLQLTRYYSEPQLPFGILHKVKREFEGKKIFGVIEVSTVSGSNDMTTEYFIKLEDNRHWTTVRVNNQGDLAVTQRLRKA